MIVEWMMSLGELLFDALFAMAGILPTMPIEVRNAVDGVFNIMFGSVSMVAIFIDMRMVRILIPLTIAVLNWDWVMKSIIFIIKKIPVIDLK